MKPRHIILLCGLMVAITSIHIQPRKLEGDAADAKNQPSQNNKLESTVTHHSGYVPGYPSYFGSGMGSSTPFVPPPTPAFATGNTPVQTTYHLVSYPSHTQTPWNLHSYPHIFDPFHGHLQPYHPLHQMSYLGPYSNPMHMMMSMGSPYGFAYNPYINPFMMGMNPFMMGMMGHNNPMMANMMGGLMGGMGGPMGMGMMGMGMMGMGGMGMMGMGLGGATGAFNPNMTGMMGGGMLGGGMSNPALNSSFSPQGADAPNQANFQTDVNQNQAPVSEDAGNKRMLNDQPNQNYAAVNLNQQDGNIQTDGPQLANGFGNQQMDPSFMNLTSAEGPGQGWNGINNNKITAL